MDHWSLRYSDCILSMIEPRFGTCERPVLWKYKQFGILSSGVLDGMEYPRCLRVRLDAMRSILMQLEIIAVGLISRLRKAQFQKKKWPVSKFLHGVADWPYKHVLSVFGVIFVAEKIWPLRNPKFAQIFRQNKLSRFQTFEKHIKNCV